MSETTLFDFRVAKELNRQDTGFHALIMAAMWKADTTNAALLRAAFPEIWNELQVRYNAPGGILHGEKWPERSGE